MRETVRSWPMLRLAISAVLASLALGTPAAGQESAGGEVAPLGWTRGPGAAPIGDGLAEIELGERYVYLDQGETQRLLELAGNPVAGNELATAALATDDSQWFVIFEWDDIGYVKDDEADELDADAILESIREGTAAANEERAKRGWTPIEVVGWHEAPHYDAKTHYLTWAIVGQGEEGRTLNRIVKLLGRKGVMTATLVSSEAELAAAVPEVDAMLAGYHFVPGHTYAEFVPGSDRVAEIGLTALIAGGAGVALAKSGLLAKFWKAIVAVGAALVAGISRLFGRSRQERGPSYPT
jgi:uncharacterized membrane-anchored protein